MTNLQSKSGKKAFRVGYTTGVFDLFHVGHLTLLKNAKALCDHLIVGVTTDDIVRYKGKSAVISYADRASVVEGIRYVDQVIPQKELDKVTAWKKLKYDVLFVGDDWYESPVWESYERELKEFKVEVVYFPYSDGVSSTKINKLLEEQREI